MTSSCTYSSSGLGGGGFKPRRHPAADPLCTPRHLHWQALGPGVGVGVGACMFMYVGRWVGVGGCGYMCMHVKYCYIVLHSRSCPSSVEKNWSDPVDAETFSWPFCLERVDQLLGFTCTEAPEPHDPLLSTLKHTNIQLHSFEQVPMYITHRLMLLCRCAVRATHLL